jgi:biotin carboxylase
MLTVEEVSRRLEDRTLTKVAKATGLSYPTILKAASGDTGIAYETVRILSDYLEATA